MCVYQRSSLVSKEMFERLIFKRRLQLNKSVTSVRQLLGFIEQVSYRGLVRKYSAGNSQDIEGRPLEFALVFNNGCQAVWDNCNIDMSSHNVLAVAPEGRDSEMLLYPSEEQLHLPSLLVQQCDIT